MKKGNLVPVFLFFFFLLFPVITNADKIGGGDVTYSPKNAAPVLFTHQDHVTKKGLKCTTCHYQIFHMQRGFYKMDMARINKGEFCGKCHNGQASFDGKDQKNCTRCHK